MTVVDASIVVRLLQNRRGDDALRERFGRERQIHAPALIVAEVTSAVRGLLMALKQPVRVSAMRAEEMVDDFADLPLLLYPMQPFQRRVLAPRHNVNAYDGFYLALAESLAMPLLTDDHKFAGAIGHSATIETWHQRSD